MATAARLGANAAAAQDLIYLAQVGAARSSLKEGVLVKARAYAALVPDTSERLAYYSANSVRENNLVQVSVRTVRPCLDMHPTFQGLNDARVPQPTASRHSLGSHPIFPLLKRSLFSGRTGTGTPQSIEVTTQIRFASGLEARYIGVESYGTKHCFIVSLDQK